jgi:hypothetical protein
MRLAITQATEHRLRRSAEQEELERLAWEVDRAVSNYAHALARFEKRHADDAGRRADEQIAAGKTPF